MQHQLPKNIPPHFSSNEKQFSLFLHLSALLGIIFPFGNIIGPLIMWLVKKDDSFFIDKNGREALNFQISITIYSIASFLFLIILFFLGISIMNGILFVFSGILLFLLSIGFLIFTLVVIIIAAVKANKGIIWRYPLSIKML